MSVEIWLLGARLVIDPEDEKDALEVLRQDYENVEGCAAATTLDEAMAALGWELDRDGAGVISGLAECDGCGDEEVLDSLGPFVRRGSYILLSSNEGPEDLFGYVFTGKRCHEWDIDGDDVDRDEVNGPDFEPDLAKYDERDDEYEDDQ